jgi:hypothetical protein
MAITMPVKNLFNDNILEKLNLIFFIFFPSNKNLKNHARNYSSISNIDLSNYLAGLIEGDGHINTPKGLKSAKGKTTNGGYEIIFALKDKPLADYLASIYGGNVYIVKNKNYVRWMVKDFSSVCKITQIVNGKFRTPKIVSLHKLIDLLNLKGANIPKLPLSQNPLGGDGWLAGFIDADGHFGIKGFTGNKKTYPHLHFILVQREKDKSGKSLSPFMKKLAKFLVVDLKKINNGGFPAFRVNTSSKISNQILIDYLNKYSLLSSKYLDFKNWEKAYVYLSEKLHKDPKIAEEMSELKSSMNSKRTFFSWDHLPKK